MARLPRSFFQCCTVDVARRLLGKKIVWKPRKGSQISAMIVETEAYLGLEDPAAHSFHGRREGRAETLYLEGGHAYIYLIYGIYHCLNAVTRSTREPEAVLIRAAMPLTGPSRHDWQSMRGPGKLCREFGLTREQNGLSLQGPELTFMDHEEIPDHRIVSTPRIGVDYAGDAAFWPLRFYIADHRAVSGSRTKFIW